MVPRLCQSLVAQKDGGFSHAHKASQMGHGCGVPACCAWRARSLCPPREVCSPASTRAPAPTAQGPAQPNGGPQHRGAPHARARRRRPAAALRAAVVGAVHPDHGGHGDDRCATLTLALTQNVAGRETTGALPQGRSPASCAGSRPLAADARPMRARRGLGSGNSATALGCCTVAPGSAMHAAPTSGPGGTVGARAVTAVGAHDCEPV